MALKYIHTYNECSLFISKIAILAILTFFLQINSKWSETRKKHETGETEFFPVAGAGSRRTTNFPCRQC